MNDVQPENASEYTRDASSRPARARGSSTNRLRATFFAIAALWGFVAGAGALAAGYHLAGNPGTVDGVVLGLAIPGAVLAALGGLVAAGAYREARDRRRR